MKDDISDMQWHDNIETAEIEGGSALDVDNILYGFKKVLEVPTSKGSMFFRKMGDRRLRQLNDEYRELLERMATEGRVEALLALTKDEKDRTLDDQLSIAKYGGLGRPWAMALTHGSLIRPKMDLDTFYDLMSVLSPEEAGSVLKTVASIYNPPEEAKAQAKRMLEIAEKFHIPIGKELTMENAPSDLLQCMNEIKQEDDAKDAIRR